MNVIFVRNWWVLAFRGLISGLLGLLAFFLPGGIGPKALAVLVLLFGSYVVINGVFALRIAFLERGQYDRFWLLEHWGLFLLEGAIGIIAGIVTLSWSPMTIGLLLYIITVWAIINGLVELGAAVWLRDVFVDESLLMVGGILSLIFGLILVFRPDAPPLAVLWLFGAFAVSTGVLYSLFAFRLRDLLEVKVDTSHHVREEVAPRQGPSQ